MNIKLGIVLLVAFLIVIISWGEAYTDTQKKSHQDKNAILELDWNDLVPDEFNAEEIFKQNGITLEEIGKLNDDAELAQKIMNDLKSAYERVGIVKALDGKSVSLTGFGVPLEYSKNGKVVKEFLLVPYKGACIHLPPPPPQKTIYVKSRIGIGSRHMSRALIVQGILRAESARSRYAPASYILESFLINSVR